MSGMKKKMMSANHAYCFLYQFKHFEDIRTVTSNLQPAFSGPLEVSYGRHTWNPPISSANKKIQKKKKNNWDQNPKSVNDYPNNE